MISIIVERSPANRTGPEITDALLTSEAAAVERGRCEIDAATPVVVETLTGPHRRWIAPGSLLRFHGRRDAWQGIVTRCSLTISRDGDTFTADRSLE
ncbi:MAG TPA: hypothetical protein PKW90_23425, partial [Myxococcota bacterium]|nr:hypothetical protein [Myxococcota bacterium]